MISDDINTVYAGPRAVVMSAVMSLEINNKEIEIWRAKVSEYGSGVWDSCKVSELKIFLQHLQQTIVISKQHESQNENHHEMPLVSLTLNLK